MMIMIVGEMINDVIMTSEMILMIMILLVWWWKWYEV